MKEETHLSPEEVAALKELFRAEASDLLEAYGRSALDLEGAADPAGLLKAIQRVVHTIKGNSMSLEFDRLAELAHRLEDLLAALRERRVGVNRDGIDLLLGCGDAMAELLECYCSEPPRPPVDVAPLTRRIEKAVKEIGEMGSAGEQRASYRVIIRFTRHCRMHSAGALLLRQRLETVGRLLHSSPDPDSAAIEQSGTWTVVLETGAKPEALKRAARVAGISSRVVVEPDRPSEEPTRAPAGAESLEAVSPGRGEDGQAAEPWSPRGPSSSEHIRMEVGKIDRIINLVGELVIGRSMVSQALTELSEMDESALSRLNMANHFLERTLTELQAVVLKIRMVPVERVFRRFPRAVRDLAIAGGKEVTLDIQGASTELDKSIADAMGEPLLHLVRNAIDHGIETPEERVRVGKPPAGRLTLAASYEGNHVHVLVEDDGRGIDPDEMRRRAVALGLITPDESDSLSREDAVNLLYVPGFSTRERVSTVSGRGMGMDVVREIVESLKGTLEMETGVGRGTRFLIRLPLTLAILKAILVESAGRPFAVPLPGVSEIVRLKPEEGASILGSQVIRLRDRVVPLVNLGDALDLGPEVTSSTGRAFVVLVGEGERRVGLVVDRLLGEYELVVKPIEDPRLRSPGIAGASILGDGKVVLILNLRGLTDRIRQQARAEEVA